MNVNSQLIVRGNQAQFEMVFLNLLNIAIDSLDAYDGEYLFSIAFAQVDGKIHLSFEDCGVSSIFKCTQLPLHLNTITGTFFLVQAS